MAKNILIDTNILKTLVSRTTFNPYLRQIHLWQEQGDITVYYPETLKAEWNKHREEELKKISDIVRKHKNVMKVSELFDKTPDIGEPELVLADKRLQAQVFAIDQLLESAVLITDEGKAASLMWEHRKHSKAPFRKKKSSDNDAVILFATLDELSIRGERELFFFSSNHTDFAAPGNEEVIHADISARYPDIKIIYFCDLAVGMQALVGVGLSTKKKSAGAGKFFITKLFPDDTGKPLAERLVSYINNRFSDISFLPKRLFCFHTPFVVGEEFTERKIPFVLNTDNKDVYNLFIDQDILPALADKSTLVEQDISEAELTDFLRSNLVYEISYQGEKPISLVHRQRDECTCSVCVFRRLQFRKSFIMLKGIDLEPASLKKAYTFYLHGDYGKSISVLEDVVKKAESERRWITYYIAKYNLLLLGRSLKYRKTSEDLPQELLSGYRDLNLDEILMVCRKASINDILDHLHYGNFLDYARDRMKELVAKLKDQNTDQIQGYTNDTESLLEVYYETVLFAEHNFLMIDNFSDLHSLTSILLDGLFASYSCSPSLQGKFLHFTDFIVSKVIAYGKSDDIIRYKKRYGIKKIKYVSDKDSSFLVDQIKQLVDSYIFLEDWIGQNKTDGEDEIWIRYKRMFSNAVVVVSITEMPSSDIDLIALDILQFLKVQKRLHDHELAPMLSFFLTNTSLFLTEETVQKFFHTLYSMENVEYGQLLHTLANATKKRNTKLDFSAREWERFRMKYLTDIKSYLSEEKVDELLDLHYFITDENYRTEIIDFLDTKIKNCFDGNIYYSLVIKGHIRQEEKLTMQYEADILRLAEGGRKTILFDTGFYTDIYLDEFVNLSFSLDRPVSKELREALEALDNYYCWVLDIDNFDYKKFNSDWLFNHLTIYYKEKFRKSSVLRVVLKRIILESKDHNLGQLYIDLYDPL
ncbi:PIN domain-containing protein [Chryseobacterium hagamense]|uniref:DUF4935 domain-containing protein n=1 Tax=Chryseobacterium hagamense TaxID=395935 RepID=A0A511YQM4_9FLAO|nr:PIN domain-containing protein [Chryseobacterium hagamense]GEN77497.1 hypothetical protein CHA01nite_32370 [Chryseobacterium hagamense]